MLDKMEIDSDDEFTKQCAANSKFFGKDAFKSVLKKQEKKKEQTVSAFRKEIKYDKKEQFASFLNSNKRDRKQPSQIHNCRSDNDSDIFNFDSDKSDITTQDKSSPKKPKAKEVNNSIESDMFSQIVESPIKQTEMSYSPFGIDDQIRMSQHYSNKCMTACIMIPSLLKIWVDLLAYITSLAAFWGSITWLFYLFIMECNRRAHIDLEVIQKGAYECGVAYDRNNCASQSLDSEIYNDCRKLYHCKITDSVQNYIPIQVLAEIIATAINEFLNVFPWESIFKLLFFIVVAIVLMLFYAKYKQIKIKNQIQSEQNSIRSLKY